MKPKKKFLKTTEVLIRILFIVAIVFFVMLSLQSCVDNCQTTTTYTYFEPVYQTTEEIRQQFEIQDPRDLVSPGKIYMLGDFLFINERGEGIHIIDNSIPSNPMKLKFINIPGNFDMAAKGGFLYADNYIDLLAIDIRDLSNIQLVKRVENVFPMYNNQFGFWADDGMVITGWEEKQTVAVNQDCDNNAGEIWLFNDMIALREGFDIAASAAPQSVPNSPIGIGGSMARFAIYTDLLYTIDDYQMTVFNIDNLYDPLPGNVINMGWGIETIFPYKDKLFIGAQNGMHIYDNATPTEPVYISSFLHVTTCDPVVVNDQYAYVTLRSGNACNGFTNQLDVINIEDLNNPYLVKSYSMQNPHGLGLDGQTLFITEGEFGLKVFDATDPNTIDDNLIKQFQDIHGYDVIPNNGVLMMIGDDGLYQYDYRDIENIELLSVIPVIKDL